LKQHVYRAVLTPEDKRRAMIGALVSCAFIARGFRQPLLIRRFSVERTLGKQLAPGKRNAAKLHDVIVSVPPFVYVLPGVIDCGDTEARVFLIVFIVFIVVFLISVLVVPVTIPARSVKVIVVRLGRSGLSDVDWTLVSLQVTGEFARKVLIDENLHRELVRSALASSSAAIAASLLTEGKLSRNSSRVSPASR